MNWNEVVFLIGSLNENGEWTGNGLKEKETESGAEGRGGGGGGVGCQSGCERIDGWAQSACAKYVHRRLLALHPISRRRIAADATHPHFRSRPLPFWVLFRLLTPYIRFFRFFHCSVMNDFFNAFRRVPTSGVSKGRCWLPYFPYFHYFRFVCKWSGRSGLIFKERHSPCYRS